MLVPTESRTPKATVYVAVADKSQQPSLGLSKIVHKDLLVQKSETVLFVAGA